MLALPPTCSSSTIYYLFFAHSVVAETYARNGMTFLFCVIHEILKGDFQLCSFNLSFFILVIILIFTFCLGACRLM
nr:MAG TPA: hypothetical protein [Bacteriophage sp.]